VRRMERGCRLWQAAASLTAPLPQPAALVHVQCPHFGAGSKIRAEPGLRQTEALVSAPASGQCSTPASIQKSAARGTAAQSVSAFGACCRPWVGPALVGRDLVCLRPGLPRGRSAARPRRAQRRRPRGGPSGRAGNPGEAPPGRPSGHRGMRRASRELPGAPRLQRCRRSRRGRRVRGLRRRGGDGGKVGRWRLRLRRRRGRARALGLRRLGRWRIRALMRGALERWKCYTCHA